MRFRSLLYLFIFHTVAGIAQPKNLDFYLAAGLQNSPLLLDYSNRLRSNQIDSLRLRAGQGLQVNGHSTNYYAPVIKGWGYDQAVTDGANLNAVVEVSKEFTGRNKLSEQFRSLQLQGKGMEIEQKISEKDLHKAIISQYIDAYGIQQQYKLNRDILQFLLEADGIAHQLTAAGVFKQTQYLSLVANLHQQELVTMQNHDQAVTALGTLNYLCGIIDTTWVELTDPALQLDAYLEARNTIFFQPFMVDSLKLLNQDRLIDFSYRPKLSVFVDGGYFSSLGTMPYKNFGFSTGLNLAVPIYDGHQKKMQHDQLIISRQTWSHYSEFFANQYNQQMSILHRKLAANQRMTGKTREQLTFVQALIEANKKLLNSGEVSVTDYLLSVSNYMSAGMLVLENKMEGYHIIAEMNYWNQTK